MLQEDNNIPFFELLGNLQAREDALKKIAGKINDKERVLDLATGSGYLVRNLIDKDAFVVCLDMDVGPLIKTKKELPDLHFVVADARNLPFKNTSFDYVVTWSALVHIEDWKDVVRESFRVSNKMLTAEPHGAYCVRAFRDFRCMHNHPEVKEIKKEFETYGRTSVESGEFITIISTEN
ncbi:class I SAM-dependent methyltransferase [archaeon]|nr:class I SAM-dependent methyltransferase [archaeon]